MPVKSSPQSVAPGKQLRAMHDFKDPAIAHYNSGVHCLRSIFSVK